MKQLADKKYIAEFVGTFSLTFATFLALRSATPDSTPIIAAITLMLFVYTVGPISGCHVNPAVTIGFYAIKKLKQAEMLYYIVAQVFGAVVALLVAQWMTGGTPDISGDNSLSIFIAEALGTAFFIFGISSVAHGKTHQAASGIVIGGSLLLGIFIASGVSNGVLNPAVAIGIGSFSFTYMLAPIVGALAGVKLGQFLHE